MSKSNDEEDRISIENDEGQNNNGHFLSSFLEKLRQMISNITLEPMLFIKMVAENNFKVVADTLEIEKVCEVNLNYSASDCAAMDDGNHTDIQTEVQKFQNIFNYHQNLIDSLVPLLIILFAGPLSDRYGRKPAMISVLIGFILLSFVYALTAFYKNWPIQVLYLATILVDLGGSWVVFNMAVYSYIADITTIETRTKRMGFADAVWYMGGPIGTLMGGYIYRYFGYIAVFSTSGILWTICLLYTIFILKETQREIEDEETWQCCRCGAFGYVISLFKTTFRKRPQNGRIHIFILIGVKLGTFLVQGHQVYLWARKMLQWDATEYSTWSSIEQGSHEIGMVSWVWFAESFGLHDCTVAAGGLFSIMLWSITLACITGPGLWWLVILASFLGSLESSIEPALRSMLTAVVGIGEEGRVLSLLGLLESAWLSADRALYTYLYNSFIETFPQINYVVQASIAFILIIVILFLRKSFIEQKKKASTSYSQHCHDL